MMLLQQVRAAFADAGTLSQMVDEFRPRQGQSDMAAAIAEKQQWVADQAAAGVFQGLAKDATWQDYADRLLAARKA